jgi:hypothetical protein
MRIAHDDPSALSHHERLHELTAILANGIHRLRETRAVDSGTDVNLPPASIRDGKHVRPRAGIQLP